MHGVFRNQTRGPRFPGDMSEMVEGSEGRVVKNGNAWLKLNVTGEAKVSLKHEHNHSPKISVGSGNRTRDLFHPKEESYP